jgi:hypothetical protein
MNGTHSTFSLMLSLSKHEDEEPPGVAFPIRKRDPTSPQPRYAATSTRASL